MYLHLFFFAIYVPLLSNMITNRVETQSLKVNMATVKTTSHKTNCLQYMYAIIFAQVVLLNV